MLFRSELIVASWRCRYGQGLKSRQTHGVVRHVRNKLLEQRSQKDLQDRLCSHNTLLSEKFQGVVGIQHLPRRIATKGTTEATQLSVHQCIARTSVFSRFQCQQTQLSRSKKCNLEDNLRKMRDTTFHHSVRNESYVYAIPRSCCCCRCSGFQGQTH